MVRTGFKSMIWRGFSPITTQEGAPRQALAGLASPHRF